MLNLRKNYQKNLFQILQKVIGKKKVALHEPYLFGNEKKYLNDCIKNNQLTYGKFNFEQGGIIVASNNKLSQGRICFEIKQIIKRYNIS